MILRLRELYIWNAVWIRIHPWATKCKISHYQTIESECCQIFSRNVELCLETINLWPFFNLQRCSSFYIDYFDFTVLVGSNNWRIRIITICNDVVQSFRSELIDIFINLSLRQCFIGLIVYIKDLKYSWLEEMTCECWGCTPILRSV